MDGQRREQNCRRLIMVCAAGLLIGLVACASGPASAPEPEVQETSPTSAPEPTMAPTEADPTEPPPSEPRPTDTPAPTGPPALPAEPQQIEFEAEDGQSLMGMYYPAAVSPADTVVLMHWAPGDQSEWVEIARWLQNRGEGGAASDPAGATWLDPSWFPPVPEHLSFAVFTFTFRGCDGGCSSFQPEGWLLDALAAVETAKGLPGVDPGRLVAIGASIGGDGAIDACDEGCLGALSLSPGSYLGVAYADAVKDLAEVEPAAPGWCLVAEGDGDSAEACGSASGDHYWMTAYLGNAHGLALIHPDADPDTLQVILDFLDLAF